ncbi:hypothetical protein [uncultured Eudoraea sp.]|jgi:hypothetical protein|uniref:hypothetical protein n=1 Tax=uncultured Eudoraea sp. TaxID=1035614 RepID=UPI002610A26C|nr:hypothetical protein [uncultured Eudoraea sp.]
MKVLCAILMFLVLFSMSSFDMTKACEYAGSNIGYIKSQTERALAAEDLNSSRFFAYKALNAIEKSKEQIEACGCDYAKESIYEGLDNLKKATRVSSLNSAKILLTRALDNSLGSLEAIREHDEHGESLYDNDMLAMNTKTAEKEKLSMVMPVGKELERKIDLSLVNYQNSLNEVVNSVECKEAYEFASKIYAHCEQELLKPKLTEAKKYYNLRTKQITALALDKLKDCNK